jgi:hypothetical protein
MALCSNSNNNDTNVDAYSNYTYYASNTYRGNQCNLKTYIKCGKYKVSNENGEEITQYLDLYSLTRVVTPSATRRWER